MEKTTLESAIREEAEKAIRAIAKKEAGEIKKLSDAYTLEMEAFRKRLEEQTEAKIRQEASKAQNRASLDLKKYRLKSFEAFINRTVEEAVKGLRGNPHYKRFLLDAVIDAAGHHASGIEIRLGSEDLVHEKELREAVKLAAGTGDMNVVEDRTIKWGGCIVVDRSGGRIFDSTIERTYFRKSAAIRREVMKLLTHPLGTST